MSSSLINNSIEEFSLPENPLPRRLQEYRQKNRFTDVTIKVGEESFPAHKIVLEDSSPVLKAILSENWARDNICEFSEQFIDSDIMEDLLTFFYTAKLTITAENAHALCMASSFLNIPSVLAATEKFLKDRISTSNVLDLFLLADKLKLEALRRSSIQCILENFETVQNDIKLVSYSFEDLQTMIRELNEHKKDPKLKEFLFKIVITWVESDAFSRSNSLPALLRLIPLSDLSLQFLSETVAQSIVSESFPCARLLNEAFSKAYTTYSQFSKTSNDAQLYCFGGQNEKAEFLSSVSCLTLTSNKWTKSTAMSTPRGYYSGTVIGTKIYICGGWIGNRKLNTLEVYDCRINTWTVLASMPHPRSSCAAAALNGFIYVTGGYDGSNNMLSSVIRYNVQTNEWQNVRAMQNARYAHQLIELNNRLYVLGGMDNRTVEMYNPATDQWTLVASMQHKHCWSGATAHNGKIYVCSYYGFEFYSPETNIWNTLTPLNDHLGKTLVSIGGKLWAMGGGNSERGTKSVFEFDTATQRWTPMLDMDVARIYHCSFVVNF